MKKTTFILIVLSALLVLSGCSKLGNGDDLDAKELHITMIGTAENDPVSLAAKQGAEDELEKLKKKYPKLEIILDWKAGSSANVMEQHDVLLDVLETGTDMIILSALDNDIMAEAIREADAMNIPVITYESDVPSSERIAYIGADQVKVGKDLLTSAVGLNANAKVAVLAGNERSNKNVQRIAGVQEALKEHKDVRLLEFVYHMETPQATLNALEALKNQHEELTTVIMLGSWAFYDESLVNVEYFEGIDVVTVDALPMQFSYIKNEVIDAAVGRAIFKFGSQSIKLAVEKLYLEKAIDEINTMKTIPVSIKNLGGWSRQMRAWGQEGIDKKYLTM